MNTHKSQVKFEWTEPVIKLNKQYWFHIYKAKKSIFATGLWSLLLLVMAISGQVSSETPPEPAEAFRFFLMGCFAFFIIFYFRYSASRHIRITENQLMISHGFIDCSIIEFKEINHISYENIDEDYSLLTIVSEQQLTRLIISHEELNDGIQYLPGNL